MLTSSRALRAEAPRARNVPSARTARIGIERSLQAEQEERERLIAITNKMHARGSKNSAEDDVEA